MPYTQPGEAICARTLTAISSTEAAGRVFPELPTQDKPPPPYVVYELIDGGDGMVLGARSKTQEYLFRLGVYAKDAITAAAIMTAIHDDDTGLPGWSDRTNGVRAVIPRGSASAVVLEDGLRLCERNYSIWFSG